jgi:hypothetical protein
MKPGKESCRKLAVVGIFAIAMAFLEFAIVVYLRKIYYPSGFSFPLAHIEAWVLNTEWVREFFTIVMLVSVAYLAGKKIIGKFAYFLYAFAVWDIFYYIWLKIILNWPSSFFTWDLLFLIPFPWIAPVLAPVISSLTMILLALCIINLQDNNRKIKINFKEVALLILGILFILYTFLIDYFKVLGKGIEQVYSYTPLYYNWFIFIIGEICLVLAIILFYMRNRK